MAVQPGPIVLSSPTVREPADRESLESTLRREVASRLGEPRFSLWFGEGVRLGLDESGGTLNVTVPSGFYREWIRTHFHESLQDAVRAVTGRRLQLEYAVRDEPVAARGEAAAAAAAVPLAADLPGQAAQRPTGEGESMALDLAPPAPPAAAPAPALSGALGPARPARRLDQFVTGPANRLAHAAAQEMIRVAGAAFNPLVIHGGIGLGKTHLLEAIAHGLRSAHPQLNVVLVTAEAFTNTFLEAMRAGTLGSFRTRYRRVGALAMDDIHFLAGTRATQNEFLHTFNALLERGAPIILTTEQHPRRIARLTDELATRFLGGMVVKLEAPDLLTRRAILQARSAARGVGVPSAVLDFIAENLRSSVRELEGALHSVIAHALLTGKRLDLALARSALRDMIRHTGQMVGLRDVERVVCELFQIEPESLRSESRARGLAYPRMLAMYLARKRVGAAYSEIGRYFGGRNHSTVISAEKKVRGWLQDERQDGLLPGFETMADLLLELERALGA